MPVTKLICDGASIDTLKNDGSLEAMQYVTKKVTGSGSKAKTTWPGLTMTYRAADGDVYCEDAGPPPWPIAGLPDIRMWYGNYLNYERALALKVVLPGSGDTTTTRMSLLKDALEAIATEYKDKINIGMMRTSTTGARQTGSAGKGGMVTFPIRPMDDPAMFSAYHGGSKTLDDFIWTMRKRVACKNDTNCDAWARETVVENCGTGKDCIGVMQPNGSAKPLAELLYEAYLYYSGQDVQYGSRSAVDPTIEFDSIRESIANPDAGTGGRYYDKPATSNCQNNYIIMLTDGLSEQDSSSNTDIKKLGGVRCLRTCSRAADTRSTRTAV